MDERTFKEYLEDTTISRYKQADAVFSQVQEALSKLAAGAETAKAEELRLAVNKIDEAIALMSYGAYGWNKAAYGKPRAILWPSRTDADPGK